MLSFIEDVLDYVTDYYIAFTKLLIEFVTTLVEFLIVVIIVLTSPLWVWFYIGKRLKFLKDAKKQDEKFMQSLNELGESIQYRSFE